MKSLLASICLCLLGICPAFAQTPAPAAPAGNAAQAAPRPSEVSLRRLLEVMEARKLVDAIPQQTQAMFSSTLKNMVGEKPLTDSQQKAFDDMRTKMGKMMAEEFNWESMQPVYLKIYGDTFTQSEVDSMTKFYSSPAGHAVVTKLPLVVQNSMTIMQEKMRSMMPKVMQMAKELAEQIKSESAGAKNPG